MRTLVSAQVREYLEHLAAVAPEHHDELGALMDYLDQHRHGAVLPDVRWKIQQSRYRTITGELRTEPPFPPYRVLFAMDNHERWLYYLVAGNKAAGPHVGNAWYDVWVPVADAFIDHWLKNEQPDTDRTW